MVDICLCSNQTLHYWKMSILAGDIQGSCTNLEVENIYSDNTTTIWQYSPIHIAMHNTMKAERPDMTSTADSLTLEVFLCNDYRSEGWSSTREVHVYLTGTFQFT